MAGCSKKCSSRIYRFHKLPSTKIETPSTCPALTDKEFEDNLKDTLKEHFVDVPADCKEDSDADTCYCEPTQTGKTKQKEYKIQQFVLLPTESIEIWPRPGKDICKYKISGTFGVTQEWMEGWCTPKPE